MKAPQLNVGIHKHVIHSSELPAFKCLPSSSGAPQRVKHLPLHLFAFSCFRDIKAKQRKAVQETMEHVAPVNISMCCQRDKLKRAGGLRWVPRQIKIVHKRHSERHSCSFHLWGERKPTGPEEKAGEQAWLSYLRPMFVYLFTTTGFFS